MFTKVKRGLLLFCTGAIMLNLFACGSGAKENTENSQETESEVVIAIADATDLLTKVWDKYETVDTDGNMYNDKFAVMGGHFESAVMDKPGKYDLAQMRDLELMYCVPQSVIPMIDDAATIVHLMKASTFTAGAYHVTDETNVQVVVEDIQRQTMENQWLGGFPNELFIVRIDEQYVVSAFGTTEVIDAFKDVLHKTYGKQVTVLVEASIR